MCTVKPQISHETIEFVLEEVTKMEIEIFTSKMDPVFVHHIYAFLFSELSCDKSRCVAVSFKPARFNRYHLLEFNSIPY